MASRISSINDLLNDAQHMSPQGKPIAPPQAQRKAANGREYMAAYYLQTYPYPCDDEEKKRQDWMGTLIYIKALRGKPSLVTLGRNRQSGRVLDVGCGSGWWVVTIADANDFLDVIGIDIADIQPPSHLCPPNARFFTPWDFTAHNWGVPRNSFDLVHHALLCGSVSDWGDFYRGIHRHVKPGGFSEGVEIDWQPRYEGLPVQQDLEAFQEWYYNMDLASRQIGLPIAYPGNHTGLLMQQAGFTDIKHTTRRLICCSKPESEYHSKDEFLYAFEVMQSVKLVMGVPQSWSGMAMELFTRFRGYSRLEVEYLGKRLSDAVMRQSSPFYFDLHIWQGHRPS